jgi:Cu(I)/Ag(I) efflux system protein CusF
MRNLSLLLLTLICTATPASAQQKVEEHAGHHASTPSAPAPVAAEMADGEVRKVDKDAKKLTIKHGEIKNLDMPPMTMVFQVKDAAILDKVKAGDKIRFVAQKSDTGFVVTDLQAAK